MLKRVEIGGFIEIPEGAELPELDQIVTVSELRVQVTGKHEDKQKRRGDTSELVYTRKTTLLDGAQVLKVEDAPEPLFDEADGEPVGDRAEA
jgi:hypothetical protein